MEWTLEIVLVVLLGATLFQAIKLERALGVLKRDRASLEALVLDFNASTGMAENGIQRLRAAADGAGRQIETHIAKSGSLKDDLTFLTDRGDRLADRLDALVRAARPMAQDRPVGAPDPKAAKKRQPDRAGPDASITDGTMMLKVPAPRLLPATIATIVALLLMKASVLALSLVHNGVKSDGIMVASANAAGAEAAKEAKAEASKEHGKPEAGKEHGKPEAGKEHGKAEAGKEAAKPAAPEAAPEALQAAAVPTLAIPEGPPPVSPSEKAILQELRQRRQDLESRADTMTTRESVLAATEQKLVTRVTELQTLQKQLEGLTAAQKQKEEAGWDGLVKVYETMKPKDAATIFNELSMPVLLQVLDRMKDSKAAAIMAAMNPEKARDVTAELAQMRTGGTTPRAPVAASKLTQAGG